MFSTNSANIVLMGTKLCRGIICAVFHAYLVPGSQSSDTSYHKKLVGYMVALCQLYLFIGISPPYKRLIVRLSLRNLNFQSVPGRITLDEI